MNDSITTTLRVLAGDTERLLAERLRPVGLTVAQMQFLTVLAANPGHCGADVAGAVHVTPQTGTTVLRNLVSKRLITVRRVPGMGHRNRISVTARGKETLGRAQDAVADVDKRLAALLGAEARFRLADSINALQPHLPRQETQSKKPTDRPTPKRATRTAAKADELHRRCLNWTTTVGNGSAVPAYVALQFGTQTQIELLVADGRWVPDGDGYRINN